METKKYVYLFKEGNAAMKNLLGGKGANLADMTSIGIPVPQGFTVTTEACNKYYEDNEVISEEVVEQIHSKMGELEKLTGKQFGSLENPLLVSVRSGARASMPGMMDTILNLGLNDETVEIMAKKTENPRFAYDSYRRFIQMFSDVVMEIEKKHFEDIMDEIKEAKGVKLDTELDADDLKELVKRFKEFYKKEKGEDFPSDPKVQLIESITAVFRSWNNPRAIVYRRLNDIPSNWGTAVNVQEMVFGNKGETSGTGVGFTRNPATGEKEIFAEYLMNAQGEDVVAGIRTPHPISKLHEDMPEIYNQFIEIANKLETHYRDMQDMEFTIEEGKLYFLQTRNGKRTAQAALKIAVDLEKEGMLTKEEAVLKVEPKQLDTLLHPNFDSVELKNANVIAKGLPASPGAACGKVYFTAEDAKEAHEDRGEKVVLVRLETSPEDIEGMIAAEGILTVRGGMTSHAAVVARGMGTCCVAGCGDLKVNEEAKTFEASGVIYHEGDYISIDGSTGNVYAGAIKTVEPEISGYFGILMGWADGIRSLKVRTNADTPRDTAQAIKFGAQGVGLCRTEHMFFDSDRIMAVREMIVAKTEEQRRKALDKLLPMQRQDFIGIYEELEGRPATIRFLDPPLHEFLPSDHDDIEELAKDLGITYEELKSTIDSLHEFNPMMGHRGCRLAVSYPEIAEMQTRAVIEAAIDVKKRKGHNIIPEIMIPLVGEVKELKYIKGIVVKTADEIIKESGIELKYLVGTMIEIPRAALTADEIAKEAEFFSFGTNDLTQMTFGFSRDDAGNFLKHYYDKKIYEFDPFQKLDQTGVGKLVKMAAELGRKTRNDLKVGICGEHGGDPSSVEFCHDVGLDYVSCSPFRVPVARLAAAQAQIKNPRK
ncbi:pyruvate, phosphate dikinase [Clostridium argentinense CDC 2741]|uniref:Pyruvate, phosphate dikinase n=1 Tax=Clostridium argentinense CDC 2741 TaxID=1418104 RepID=A0A0C1U1L9_9CLOT|nr:pyruvate, phosphate dikinase [Clostridium argentinense]ARC85518.1 pyruvate, phosphate dikinase [Clostridium argentinense]KIE46824.1 pyruvate, phosphate dikinase [Clostridium argentinense CDC 2741]NFF40031.1 pyruvate, phosphate dikinase [Clostridium argentinense]NFP50269.1 pyruvate, phosphate dikinase [Clostridium argentinense]NFP71910.1 pyruvate, phosphate dikinase [Clostridium argentinense]